MVIEWHTTTKTISLIKVAVSLIKVAVSLVEVTVSLVEVVATLVEVVATLVEAADSLVEVVTTLVGVADSLVEVVGSLIEVIGSLIEVVAPLIEVVATLICTKDVLQKIVSCFQILSWSTRSASGARAGTKIELSGSCGHKHEGPKETHYHETLSIFVPIRTSNVVLTPRCRLNCIMLSGDCYIGTSGSKTGCGTPRLEVGHLASLRTHFMAGEYHSAQRRLSFSVSFKASASPSVH